MRFLLSGLLKQRFETFFPFWVAASSLHELEGGCELLRESIHRHIIQSLSSTGMKE